MEYLNLNTWNYFLKLNNLDRISKVCINQSWPSSHAVYKFLNKNTVVSLLSADISSFHAMLSVHQVIILQKARWHLETKYFPASSRGDVRRLPRCGKIRRKSLAGRKLCQEPINLFFSFTPFSSSSGGSECTYRPCHISKVILSNVVTHVLINTPSSFYSFRITYCLFSSKINYL